MYCSIQLHAGCHLLERIEARFYDMSSALKEFGPVFAPHSLWCATLTCTIYCQMLMLNHLMEIMGGNISEWIPPSLFKYSITCSGMIEVQNVYLVDTLLQVTAALN